MVEVWATPLPEAAPLAVPAPDPDPAELRGESLIIVDTVAEKKNRTLTMFRLRQGGVYYLFNFFILFKN